MRDKDDYKRVVFAGQMLYDQGRATEGKGGGNGHKMPEGQIYDARPYDNQCADESDHNGKPSPDAHNFSKE